MSIPILFLNTAPGPIVDLLVVHQSSSSDIQIQWSAPMEVNGALIEYIVVVGEFQQPSATAQLYNWKGTNTSVTVSAHGLGK